MSISDFLSGLNSTSSQVHYNWQNKNNGNYVQIFCQLNSWHLLFNISYNWLITDSYCYCYYYYYHFNFLLNYSIYFYSHESLLTELKHLASKHFYDGAARLLKMEAQSTMSKLLWLPYLTLPYLRGRQVLTAQRWGHICSTQCASPM